MSDLFIPSQSHAQRIDSAVRSRLIDSLPWLAETFSALALPADQMANWRAEPVDFGLYYDLAQAIHAGTVDQNRSALDEVAQHLTQRISGPQKATSSKEPLVTNLSTDTYPQIERDCLIRWFDQEPDNAMALLPLTDDEMTAARARIKDAMGYIHQVAPELHGELCTLTTHLILAKPGPDAKLAFGGASTFTLWGAIALNGLHHGDWYAYLASLVHEYAHNLLFGIAMDQPLVLNAPEERYLSPIRGTMRPVDGIYHACFVSARVALFSRMAMDTGSSGALAPSHDQLRADYDHAFATYRDCREVLAKHAKLSDLGAQVLADTDGCMTEHAPA